MPTKPSASITRLFTTSASGLSNYQHQHTVTSTTLSQSSCPALQLTCDCPVSLTWIWGSQLSSTWVNIHFSKCTYMVDKLVCFAVPFLCLHFFMTGFPPLTTHKCLTPRTWWLPQRGHYLTQVASSWPLCNLSSLILDYRLLLSSVARYPWRRSRSRCRMSRTRTLPISSRGSPAACHDIPPTLCFPGWCAVTTHLSTQQKTLFILRYFARMELT